MNLPLAQFVPSESVEAALDRAAEALGVQPGFWDVFGTERQATPEIKRAILRSTGIAADTREDLDEAVEERLWQDWSRPLPPTLVVGRERPIAPISIPEEFLSRTAQVEVVWESGECTTETLLLDSLAVTGQAELRGRRFLRLEMPIPRLRGSDPPLGYHQIKVSCTTEQNQDCGICRLIVCPERALLPEEVAGRSRMAGIAISLYGLRSERNWGCGDFTDLERFTDWVARHVGADFIALNPLHAIPNRSPYNTSPYLPNCSYFRNFLYLDVERVEDLRHSPWAQSMLRSQRFAKEIAELRRAELVEYERVSRWKLRFLKAAFRAFRQRELAAGTARARQFTNYVAAQGHLLDAFAIYSALDEVLRKRDPGLWIWPDWPAEYQDPRLGGSRRFAEQHGQLVLFYKYVQWQLDLQLEQAQAHARSGGLALGLYHDLALATDRCGSDLWAHRDYYAHGCRVGAPPDAFSPKGQDWGFPPPKAEYHRLHGYEMFRASIRNNCRHGGALRIDHVMRFFRLYWIPDGMDATQGAYVKDHAEDLLRILALESVRNRVIVVGEDLGTVEPEVREQLAKFGILSYRLLYFEKDWNEEFRLPHEYPYQALVASTTHDLATLAGFWSCRDVEARWKSGLLHDEAGYRVQRAKREEEKQKLLDVLFRLKLLPATLPREAAAYPELSGELHNAIIGFLVSTQCSLMLLNEEDLTKETEQQNLPGSTTEYPNWRRKMPYTIEDLFRRKDVEDFTRMFRNWLDRSGRLHR